MDWAGVIANEPTEKEEMFRLATGFDAQMHKRAAGSEVSLPPFLKGNARTYLHQMKRLRRTGQ